MPQTLGHVTLLVRDYNEALAFFTSAIGFRVIEDTPPDEGKRWLLVAPRLEWH
jgi:catechol 2,3-dioxygenase-like lactoylglutathione lyase family enzyme